MADQLFIELCGRYVQGDAFAPQTRGYQGRPLTDLAGNPKTEYFIAVAVAKEPAGNANALYAAIYGKAQQDFTTGEWQLPSFKWKVEDGDAGKNVGKPWAPGTVLFKLKTKFPPTIYDQAGQQIVDPNLLKRGNFVRVSVGVQGNKNTGANAGMYLNLGSIQLIGYGEEISGGRSFEETFTTPAVLPPGASATPVAPAAAMPGAPPGQAPLPGMAPPPGVPAPGAPAAAAPYGAPAAPAALPAPPVPVSGAPAPLNALPAAPQAAAPVGDPPAPSAPPGIAPAGGVPGVPMPGTTAPIAAAPAFLQPGAAAPAAAQPAAPAAPAVAPAAPAETRQPIGYDANGQPIYY